MLSSGSLKNLNSRWRNVWKGFRKSFVTALCYTNPNLNKYNNIHAKCEQTLRKIRATDLNLRARAGKIYLKIMIFLNNLINFHWIFTCRLQKSDFSNFSNFCIFAARCKKNYRKPFDLWIFISIRSKNRASLPRKWHTMIFNSIRYIYTKFVKNYRKLYISVKPKILPEGR